MPKAFEVTIQGSYRSQLIINRLTFWNSLTTPSVSASFPLARALGFDPTAVGDPVVDSVFEKFLAPQTQYYQMEKVFIRNLYDVTDFYTMLPVGVGWAGAIPASTAGSASSFVAQKIRTNRIRTDVRSATLALTPPSEGTYDVDGVLTGGHVLLLQDLCDYLNAPPQFTDGLDTGIFVPAVFKKEKYVPDGNEPDEYAYRYPDDIDTLFETSAIGVTWSPVARVSTQTSRRIGKGR